MYIFESSICIKTKQLQKIPGSLSQI